MLSIGPSPIINPVAELGVGDSVQAWDALLTRLQARPPRRPNWPVAHSKPPSSVPAGSTFNLVVAAEDGDGNVDTSYSGNVTVTDWWQTLGGTTTLAAVNGVPPFSNLTLNQADSGEYLYVSGDGLPSVSTNNFSVTPAAATQLSIPYVNNVTAGSPFSITVNALDPYGNVNPTYSGDVTLALANNPGVSTLGGTP